MCDGAACTTQQAAARAAERVEEALSAVVRVVVGAVVVARRVAEAGADRQRQVLRLQSLADIVVGAGVNGPALDVAEEVVQGFDGPLARIHALQVLQRVCGGGGVVDLAIARVVLGRVVVELVVGHVGGVRLGVGVRLRQVLAGTVVSCWSWVGQQGRQEVCRVRLTLAVLLVCVVAATILHVGVGRAHEDRVVSVRLDMLLEILRTLKGLAAEIALVRFERNMDADVRSDVIALDRRGAAGTPLAG